MNLTRLVPKSPWLAVTKNMEVSEKDNTVTVQRIRLVYFVNQDLNQI